MAVILEPKIRGVKADEAIKAMGLDYSHRIEAMGFSGGIWLTQSREYQVEIIVNDWQFVHVRIRDGKLREFFMTCVYASPSLTRRKLLWNRLGEL